MKLDIRTVVLLITANSFLVGGMMFLAAGSYPSHVRGIRRWAWSCMAHSLAWALLSLRGSIPDFFSIVVAQSLLTLALSANYSSLREFLGLPLLTRLLCAGIVGITCALLFFTYVVSSNDARIILMSLTGTLFLWASGLLLLRSTGKMVWPVTHTYKAMICCFALCGMVCLLRSVYLGWLLLTGEYLHGWTMVITLFFAAIFVEVVMLSFGFLLMCSDQINAELEQLATLDPLTAILNRSSIEKVAFHALESAKRSQSALCLLLFDIDHFKRINDTFGHAGGDLALKNVVQVLQTHLRGGDVLGRFGGEEFLVVAANTELDGALLLGERLRAAIEASSLSESPAESHGPVTFTISAGVAQFQAEVDDYPSMLRRADIALYAAKAKGRNRVVAENEDGLSLR